MPVFSIIVPVFNGERFIQQTLNSIYSQTFSDYELIVVDGASTDSTLQILHKNQERINSIISETDNGMYQAINKGFKIAKGTYLCYINSDDRLLPDTLLKVIKKFKKGNYDLVFGDVRYISEYGKPIYKLNAINLPASAIKYIKRLTFAQQSAFWTKDIYLRIGGFDESLKYCADSKFFLSIYLLKNIRFGYVSSILGEYRLHSTSFSIGSLNKMKNENREMIASLTGLKNNKVLNLFWEALTKIINIPGIIRKRLYKGIIFK